MKEKIIWFPVFVVLIVTIMLSGCATKKDLSSLSTGKDLSSLLVIGAIVGAIGLISLFDGDGEDEPVTKEDSIQKLEEKTSSTEAQNTGFKLVAINPEPEISKQKDSPLSLISYKKAENDNGYNVSFTLKEGFALNDSVLLQETVTEDEILVDSKIKENEIEKNTYVVNVDSPGFYKIYANSIESIKDGIVPSNYVFVQGGFVTKKLKGNTNFRSGKVAVAPFYISEHELTQGEYEKYGVYFEGQNPTEKNGLGSNYPVYNINWYQIIVYCNKRSIAEGLEPCYRIQGLANPDNWGKIPESVNEPQEILDLWDSIECDFSANGYRMPTDTEWEYAALGGSKGIHTAVTKYAGSNTLNEVGWYKNNSLGKVHEVKNKKPNSLGIYDMNGNIAEWCWNDGSAYSLDTGIYAKKTNGGSWDSVDDEWITVSYGSDSLPYYISSSIGVRLVRTALENVGYIDVANEVVFDLETFDNKKNHSFFEENCSNIIKITGNYNKDSSSLKSIIFQLQQDERYYEINKFDTILDLSNIKGMDSLPQEAVAFCKKIKHVKLPESINTIGPKAFLACLSLESITIPQSVTVIEAEAFAGCNSLKQVTIPKNVIFLGESFLSNCDNLEEVNILGNVKTLPRVAFYSCENLKKVTLPNTLNTIVTQAFAYCKNLKSIEIPESVISIELGAFQKCENLSEIYLPNNLSSLGNGAFQDCLSLKEFKFPKNLKEAGDYLFSGCTNLEKVTLNNGITKLGERMFSNCTKLENLTIPKSVTDINDAFENCHVKHLVLEEGITTITDDAFFNCVFLETVSLPKSITKIQDDAFNGCTALKEITIPMGVSVIPNNCFANCSSLKNIILPETITSIKSRAFFNCSSIEQIILPKNLETISNEAFSNCTKLSSIEIPEKVTSLEWKVFSGCVSLKSLPVMPGVTSIYSLAFEGCTGFTEITIPKAVTRLYQESFLECTNVSKVTIQGNVFNYGCFADLTSLKTVVLTNDVTVISGQMFENCVELEEITIPNSIKEIQARAFQGCSKLRKIILPEGLTTLGSEAFMNCTNLASITIPNSIEVDTSYFSFPNCPKLKFEVFSDNKNFSTLENGTILLSKDKKILFSWPSASKKIKIPEGVIKIMQTAFLNNDLIESVSVSKNISTFSISNCKNLKSIIIAEGISEIMLDISECPNMELLEIPASINVIGVDYGWMEGENITLGYLNGLEKFKFKVNKNNKNFSTSKDGRLLLSKDGKTLLAWPSASGDITIPKGITNIGNHAMFYSKIESLTIGKEVSRIGIEAFYGSTVKSINILSEKIALTRRVFDSCQSLEKIDIKGDVLSIAEDQYVSSNSWFTNCENLKEVNIYGNVNCIPRYCFANCTNLTEVNLLGKVDEIDSFAFSDCENLTKFTIPTGLTHIGDIAFSNCIKLSFFDVSKNKNFKTLNNGTTLLTADGKCLIFWAGASGDVVVPDGIEEIYGDAFSACQENSITTITLPKSVKDISDADNGGCFLLSSCFKSLKVVNFGGTKEHWQDLLDSMNPVFSRDIKELPVIYNY